MTRHHQAPSAAREIWIYVLMASVVVLTALTGLYLNHLVVSTYDSTVRANLPWTERTNRYGRLAELSGEISSAGLDIYDSKDVQGDLPEMLGKMERLDKDLAAGREELLAESRRPAAGPALARLIARFDQMIAAQDGINDEISLLLTALRTDHMELANRGMSRMNRQLAALQRALEGLRGEVEEIQLRAQAAQQARTSALQRYERLIASLCVLMVALVALFGVRFSRGAQRQALERERLLSAMRKRNEEMRLVLDNVNQGLITLDLRGVMSQERSAILDSWLGPQNQEQTFWDYIAPSDPHTSACFALGWQSIVEDVLPLELSLDQLPKRMAGGGRSFQLSYQPLFNGASLSRILLILSDVTARIERDRVEAERREILAIFEKILRDKGGFVEFLGETGKLVAFLTEREGGPRQLPEVRRLLHTLKGNCGIFGLHTIAQLCHGIETTMKESGGDMEPGDRERLAAQWHDLAAKLTLLLDPAGPGKIEVDEADYEHVVAAVQEHSPHPALLQILESWKLDPVRPRLERFAEQIQDLGQRLGKGSVRVHVEPNQLRLSPERWGAFWAAFAHAVRNAVDHGLETPAERTAAGKPAEGQVLLRSYLSDGHFVIEIGDDGRGIDWERLRERARERGLPSATREDLIEALFEDGISTREEVSEHSGRGVGMGAIRQVVRRLGGTTWVESESGRGTLLRFRFPQEAMTGPEGYRLTSARTGSGLHTTPGIVGAAQANPG